MDQVNNHYYGAPAATPANPVHSLAPFNDAPVDRISPCFMGRDEDMQAIASAVDLRDRDAPFRYAVWGMPGLGKSQLALSYANASFREGRHTHVIWIPASTLEKVNQGLAKVLDLFQHVDRHNPDQSARLTAARLCLERSDEHLKWLIILDDATPETLRCLREHLPRQNAYGSILITTRTRDVAEAVASVAGQQYPVHELKALSTAQSAELLFKRAGIHSSAAADLESAQQLVKKIGCLPLAVEQAGSYMRRSGLTGAGQLATLYDQGGLEEIIGWDNSLSTYEEKSVLATVTVQLRRLGMIDPHLLMLLQVLSFFDPESIPLDIVVLGAGRVAHLLATNGVSEESSTVPLAPPPKPYLLRKWIRQLSNIKNQPARDFLPDTEVFVASADVSVELRPLLELICSDRWLRGALRHLEDHSLAQPHYNEKTSLHIHSLIQLVLQGTTTNQLGEDPHCALAVSLLCGAFETIEDVESPHSWTEWERFVPHLMALLKHAGRPTPELLSMNAHVAWYFFRRGRYDEAEALYQKALAGQEEQLGSDHTSTLGTANNLAALYWLQGKYAEAEALYRRALSGQEQKLGADHPRTLNTVSNLAMLYERQGAYKEAEVLYQRALAGQQQQLGADHPGTLGTVKDLGWLYVQCGKYEEAEILYRRALEGFEKQLGADHPYTLSAVDNLSGLCYNQGQYTEAEKLYQRALAGREQQLGGDHPSTLRTVNNLGWLYVQCGKYEEAETLCQRALEGFEQQLGGDHPDTLNSVNNLGWLYVQCGKNEEAQALCQRALAGREQQLGADHRDTLETINILANLRVQQSRLEEAETLFNRALTGRVKAIGVGHPDTLLSMESLARLYEMQGRLEEAQLVRTKALKRI
ncbi:TPR-like protein [Athelia psychrophila]|uniref:TPR-like protein n=1 Tax=Athelia psychrophila TaxID=1759441 RepID=A0A165ZE13_9AGAM|nr:TPR-like protein [Fibularhizoctonia sp. CBS 109695]